MIGSDIDSLSVSAGSRRRNSVPVSESPANMSTRRSKDRGATAAAAAPAPPGFLDAGADLHLLFSQHCVALCQTTHTDVTQPALPSTAAAPALAVVADEVAPVRQVVEKPLGIAQVAQLRHQRIVGSLYPLTRPFSVSYCAAVL